MPYRPKPLIQITFVDPLKVHDLLRGVASYATTYGPWRFLLRSGQAPDLIDLLRRTPCEGLICHFAATLPLWAEIEAIGKPLVGLHGHPPHGGVVHVDHDRPAVGRTGARHLLERRIAHYAYAGNDTTWSREQEAGFVDEITRAAAEAGEQRAIAAVDRRNWSVDELQQPVLMRDWVASLTRPVGIMACNDHVAALVMDACEALSLRVPEEVAVLGVDNNVVRCEFTPTPFSSIALDAHAAGYEAAGLLDQLMRGEAPARSRLVIEPKGVVTRRSTELPLFADADLDDAVRFIRDHAHEGATVDDVVRRVAISRRSLERKFRETVGRSPDQELRRVRLDRARDLLIKSNMPLVEVADRCGFSSLSYLSQSFKHAYGLPPREYRQQHRPRALPPQPRPAEK